MLKDNGLQSFIASSAICFPRLSSSHGGRRNCICIRRFFFIVYKFVSHPSTCCLPNIILWIYKDALTKGPAHSPGWIDVEAQNVSREVYFCQSGEMSDSETELLLNPITKRSSSSDSASVRVGGGGSSSSSRNASAEPTVYRNRRKHSSGTMCGIIKRMFGWDFLV